MPKLIEDETVYEAVMRLVAEKGYARATTKRLAKAAGIHETTLFNRYGSKIDLVTEATRFYLSNSPLKEVVYTGDIEADLLSILLAYQDTLDQIGDVINALILQLSTTPELQSITPLILEDVQPTLTVLVQYQKEGLLKRENPMLMMMNLIGPFFVTSIVVRQKVEHLETETVLKQRVNMFLYGHHSSD